MTKGTVLCSRFLEGMNFFALRPDARLVNYQCMANRHTVIRLPNRRENRSRLHATRKTNFDGTKLPAVLSRFKTTTHCIDRSSLIASTAQNHCSTNFNTVPNPSFITLLTGTKSRILSSHRMQGSPLPKEAPNPPRVSLQLSSAERDATLKRAGIPTNT
jgi:hypothetical protein